VDGDTLLSIKRDDLKTEFHFKIGEAITLWNAIVELRQNITVTDGYLEFL
jgi:hypothetical protein